MTYSKIAASFLIGLSGLAQAGVAVVGHSSASPLTKGQVEDMFLGKNQNATLIDQPEGAPTREQFYAKATGRDAAQIKATWSRIVFSGKGVPPKVVGDAAAVKKAVSADPKAVGYIDSSAVDASVKVLLMLD